MDWQPIETAPDDYILAWHEDWPHPVVLDMLDFGECFHPVGWNKPFPTHWMPLPAPPTKENA